MDNDRQARSSDDSIRVTLRISDDCRNDILWLAEYYNTTQKGVFDRLVRLPFCHDPDFSILISAISETRKEIVKTRKAQVMSREAHRMLGALAKKHNMARDVLVEVMSSMVRTIAAADLKPVLEKHKEALKIVNAFLAEANKTEKNLGELLGKNDPIVNRFGYVMVYIENLFVSISREIEEGIPVDPEEF